MPRRVNDVRLEGEDQLARRRVGEAGDEPVLVRLEGIRREVRQEDVRLDERHLALDHPADLELAHRRHHAHPIAYTCVAPAGNGRATQLSPPSSLAST